MARALRRDPAAADRFPQDVVELLGWLEPAHPGQAVQAVPGAGADVPVWILGSSLYGAGLAAELGLPYAFASHFAPAALDQAITRYHARFRPSARLARPYVMLGVNAVVADSEGEARRLSSSLQQAFVNLRRGQPGPLPPPVDDYEAQLGPLERMGLEQVLAYTFVGTAGTVCRELAAFVERTGADELMVASQIHDHAVRVRSYELLAAV